MPVSRVRHKLCACELCACELCACFWSCVRVYARAHIRERERERARAREREQGRASTREIQKERARERGLPYDCRMCVASSRSLDGRMFLLRFRV